MRRTQISLESEQYDLLVREAQQQGISVAAVVRGMIVKQLQQPQRGKAKPARLAAVTGLGEGDGHAIGRNHNEFLYARKPR